MILSTCHRVQLYVAAPDATAPGHELVDFLAFGSRLRPEQFQRLLYTLTDAQATAHLFRVAAGLESMILGESEVTAQVKQAYLTANAAGATGTVLNRLFQKALHSAKIVRSRTKITEGQTSIGSVVVRLARQLFGESLQGRRALLWGAGKAAAATTRHLVASQIGELWIVNRTQAKAEDLASLCKGQWMAWEEAQRRLAEVDIAVVCTQAPHYVIDRADVEAVLPLRRDRPLFLVDLAVPRNVDPTLREESGVRLYNIDDLQSIAHTGLAARRQELASCLVLIDEQVGHFQRWRNTHPSTEGWQASPSATTADA